MAYAPTTDSSVELRDAIKRFGEVAALAGIDLTVASGEFLTLLGPSGCGKTTTLRIIAGFELLTGGDVRIGGESVAALPPNRRPVNTVFQNYALFPHLNVYENVAFGLRLRRCSAAEIDRRVRQALDLVQLTGLHERRPRQLSGGQQQRVALARALVLEPRVLLLDEPLGALDLKLRREMQLELKALQRRLGMTFIYVTHDQEEAFALSDRVAVMNRGRIVQLGEPAAIYEDPADAWVANFVGEANLLPVTDLDQLPVFAPEGWLPTVARRAPGGQPLYLMVRPERVRLEPSSGDGAGSPAGVGLSGRIVDQIFAGPLRRWLVELPNGRRLVAAASNTGDGFHRLTIGSEVRVSWHTGDSRILAAGDLSA